MASPSFLNPGQKPLTLRRFLDLYLPLALTFLLMSGASPIINKGIGRLPDEITGLAAFANAFVLCLFLYSPVFATRDSAQKFVRGRTSYRRILVFHSVVAVICTCFLLVVSLTSIADAPIFRLLMQLPESLVPPVKRAVLAFLPMPVLITLRQVHQAIHITNETPKWIGVGTALRFVALGAFVFAIGVPLGMEGGVMGGLAFSIGVLSELVVNFVTARRKAEFLREDRPEIPAPSYRYLRAFCFPLFLANAMGVMLQPFAIAIVNAALLAETSAAAFGIVKSFIWFFSSTLFAMQAMALARADSVKNLRRLLAFELIPVGTFSALILVTAYVTPIREAVLRQFFEVDDTRTLEFVRQVLPIAVVLPALMAVRSTARGVILRSGRTAWASLASFLALAGLVTVKFLGPSAGVENGAVVGYLAWLGAMAVEMLVLVYGIGRLGLAYCVSEGERATARSPGS